MPKTTVLVIVKGPLSRAYAAAIGHGLTEVRINNPSDAMDAANQIPMKAKAEAGTLQEWFNETDDPWHRLGRAEPYRAGTLLFFNEE